MSVIGAVNGNEEIIGGVFAFFIAFYGVYKKFKNDAVENANQRAEIDIINHLTQQRDFLLEEYEKSKQEIKDLQKDIAELTQKNIENHIDISKYQNDIQELTSENETLNQLVEYLSDSIELIRDNISNN